MSKLGTKNIELPKGGGSLPKTLSPGNYKCTIEKMSYREVDFVKDGLEIFLHVVGPEIENFEGFMIDPDDPSKGNHKGQVGRVRASRWAYADFETKKGEHVSRDEQILKLIGQICMSTSKMDWFDKQDHKHETIEDFIAQVNKDQPFKDTPVYFCIGAKEYMNRNGYKAYDLFLPKWTKEDGAAFSDREENVATYNPEKHLMALKVEKSEEFEADDSEIISDEAADDFSLD